MKQVVQLAPDRHPHMLKYLSNLSLSQRNRFQHLGRLADIEDCISNIHWAAQLTEDGHPDMARFLFNLGLSKLRCYDCLGGLHDIENSILNQMKALRLTEDGDLTQTIQLLGVGSSYWARFDLLGNPANLQASISTFRIAVKSKTAYPRDALKAARNSADLLHQHDNVSSALDDWVVTCRDWLGTISTLVSFWA